MKTTRKIRLALTVVLAVAAACCWLTGNAGAGVLLNGLAITLMLAS